MTQCERIIAYIRLFGSISALEAFNDLGVMRLASRINDIARAGYVFEKTTETSVNRFGQKVSYTRYRLAEAA